MGVETPIRTDKTMPLGTSEVTVLDQATAYSVLPSGGLEPDRHGITQIINYSGEVLYDHKRDKPERQRILSEEAIRAMNGIMTQIPEWGTRTPRQARRYHHRRQDGHHPILSGRQVCRLHRQFHRSRLVRQ